MRTSPTGASSTSGVFPTRSSSEGATVLSTAFPEVHGRTELPEQLVDAPELAGLPRRHIGPSVALDELRLAPAQAGQAKQVVAGVPASVLDHPFAPLASEARRRDELQPRSSRTALDSGGIHALRNNRECLEEALRLPRLEQFCRKRDVREHP